jgi:hypothetical protein
MGRKKTFIHPSPTAVKVHNPEALKREIAHDSQVEWQEDYIRYGEGDALPLKIASVVDQSPATKACLKTRAKFIKGARFSNPELMKKKIDKNGTTLWQLHSLLSDMISLFDGFSVNFKYNGAYKITNSYVLSFESCRLKRPDEKGNICSIKFNPYFGTSEYKQADSIEYPIYNLELVGENMSQATKKGKPFQGQAYYYGKTTPLHRFNPIPDYWSGQFWINIDAKIQEFHATNLDKNFLLSVLWNAIGDPEAPSKNKKYNKKVTGTDGVVRIENPKTVGEEFNDMLTTAFAGSSKGGAGIVFWSGNADTATKVSAFPTNSNHDLFTTLQDLTTKNITIATQVPGILCNISEGQNLGSNGDEMRAAIELMQSRVSEEQQILMDFYNEVLLPNLAEPTVEKVEIVNFTPITVQVNMEDKFWEALTPEEKRKWMAKNVPGIELIETVAPVQTLDEEGKPIPAPEEAKVNENIKNMTGRQLQGVQRIVRKFNKQELTLEQATQLLKNGYGFSDTDVNDWLILPEEE